MEKVAMAIALLMAAPAPVHAGARGEEVLRKAGALAGDNKVRDALNLLNAATEEITAGPESARIWHEIGAANERLGDEPRAIGAYWQAVELAEVSGETARSTALAALWNIGTIYFTRGLWDRLDPVFVSYRSVRNAMPAGGPQQGAYAVRFAVLFHAAHKVREAEALYREGVALLRAGPAQPELSFGLSNLGSLYSSQSRHEEAIACVKEALEVGRSLDVRSDRLALLQINMAAVYLHAGRAADAAVSLSASAVSMQTGETNSEIRLAFYWTSANLARKMHHKHDAAAFMAMWKSLSGGSAGADAPAAIDVGELRATRRH